MSDPKFDKGYARRKLALVLRDLNDYTADEFWREISRIASGATGLPSAEQLKELAKELEQSSRTQPEQSSRWRRTLEQIARYPRTRSEELSAPGMREMAREALSDLYPNLCESAQHNVEQAEECPTMPDKFYEGLGWMHAECCAALDRGEDPRAFEVGDMVNRCIHDLTRPWPPKLKEDRDHE